MATELGFLALQPGMATVIFGFGGGLGLPASRRVGPRSVRKPLEELLAGPAGR